jgi:hypothetical protein
MVDTIMGAVVSLDGYIAYTDGGVGPLFDWYGNGDVEWKWTHGQTSGPAAPRYSSNEAADGFHRGLTGGEFAPVVGAAVGVVA